MVAAIRAGFTGRFATATALLDGIKARFGDDGAVERYIAALVAVDVLALDDLGAHYDTPWAVSRLFDLLNSRVARGATTIVTSNQPPERAITSAEDEWGARRIASRLIGSSVVLVLRAEGDSRDIQGAAHRDWLAGITAPAPERSPEVAEALAATQAIRHPHQWGDRE